MKNNQCIDKLNKLHVNLCRLLCNVNLIFVSSLFCRRLVKYLTIIIIILVLFMLINPNTLWVLHDMVYDIMWIHDDRTHPSLRKCLDKG